MSKMSLPRYSWSRRFDEPEPDEKIHKFSTPPILEILQLLPVAYRVGSYVYGERSNHREPIFDLNGLSLSPPHPGPHAGCPIGGIGSGCIGRGFKGEFRRFCLTPGRYIHQVITSNVFAVRIKYRNQIYSKVLSVYPPEIYVSCLYSGQWDFTMPNQSGTYHACFPIAWTIYEDVIPGIQIIIKQISPFLVENYSESCLPTAVFEVEVKRRRLSSSSNEQQKPSKDDGKIIEDDENIEISIILVYQNGLNEDHKSKQPARKQTHSFHHQVFTTSKAAATSSKEEDGQKEKNIVGIQMNSIQTALYHCPPPSATGATSSSTSSATADGSSSNDKDNKDTEKEVAYSDPQAIVIATSAASSAADTNITYCRRFQTMKSRSAVQISLTQPYREGGGSEGQAASGGGDTSWCGGNGLGSPNVDDTVASLNKKKNKNNNKQQTKPAAGKASSTAVYTAATGEAASSSSIEKIVTDTASKVILGGESNASQQQQQSNSNNTSNNKGYSSLFTAETSRAVVDPESLAAYRIWQSFHYTGNLIDSLAVDAEVHCDQHIKPGHKKKEKEKEVKEVEDEELEGARYGSALCVKKTINLCAIMAASGSAADGGDSDQQQYVSLADFSFSLSWDSPIVRFGYQSPLPSTATASPSSAATAAATNSTAGTARTAGLCTSLPRYYTRFFLPSRDDSNTDLESLPSRKVASELACYSLCHVTRWNEMIRTWQEKTIGQVQMMLQSHGLLTEKKEGEDDYSWYYSHLFNELYYLVDGGTVWLDSSQGISNQSATKLAISQLGEQGQGKESKGEREESTDGNAAGVITNPPSAAGTGTGNKLVSNNKRKKSSKDDVVIVVSQQRLQDIYEKMNHHSQLLSDYILPPSSSHSQTKTSEVEGQSQRQKDVAVTVDNLADGLQSLIGQFLYYEGHEYYMYNTYDVHFYASFALFSCYPLLELSLQQDILSSIDASDDTSRMMMGEGYYRPRKTQHVVPHDVGSPSEYPWRYVNAYNFQDVSQWKDLGTKCVLQNYRNVSYLLLVNQADKKVKDRLLHYLAKSIYPTVLTIMCYMEQQFDLNCDGMIENAGFPDQTYDIWTATGVSAYCGGLWISACEAMVAMADLLAGHTAAANQAEDADDEQAAAAKSGYQTQCIYFTQLVQRARLIYQQTLWNGYYLEYDNHLSSRHHDSIMADMLAGQWYARACGLTQGILPSDSDEKIWSCLQVIYQYNVVQFGQGSWMGAVNGMRPSRPFSLSGSTGGSGIGGSIDTTCLQSREVWTGTTYALAATMLLEALHTVAAHSASSEEADIKRRKQQLIQMAFNTARGIHDGGWQKFGYWFATPEGWEKNGNYRSLGYMRPLCIWSMQYAMQLHELQEMQQHRSSKTSVEDSSKFVADTK